MLVPFFGHPGMSDWMSYRRKGNY